MIFRPVVRLFVVFVLKRMLLIGSLSRLKIVVTAFCYYPLSHNLVMEEYVARFLTQSILYPQ